MKVSTLLISFILSLSNATWAGPSDAEHKPMRGGVLVTVKDTTTAIPRLLGTPSTTGFTAVLEDKTGARVTGSFSWLAQGC